jgi:Putative metallopeptidase
MRLHRSLKLRFRIALCLGLSVMSASSAQNTGNASRSVNGYPIPDANKVYSVGQQIRVEEPHGAYTGLILMDKYYFFRPISVTETERKQYPGQDGFFAVKGTVSASVRRAVGPSWQKMTFRYGCDDRELSVGRTELARAPDGHEFIIGDHNAVCSLKPPPETTAQETPTSHVYVEPWNTLIHDTVSVKAGQALQYNFGLTRGTQLSAQFQVSGGLNNSVGVFLLDQVNYQQRAAGQHYSVIKGASSEVRGVGRYNFMVPQTGVYYVVLDNGRAWMMPRKIILRLDAVLPEATPESEKARQLIERLYAALKTAFVFPDFQISVRHCGVVNAFSNPNITLCSELIDELSRQNLPGALEFVLFHELGHTLLRTWGLPLWDNEDAADEFATVFMMMFKLQQGALQAAQWWASQSATTADAVAKLYMDDRHSLSPQRARNVVHWLNNGPELIPRWQKQMIPNMQTALLQELLRNPQGFDREQVRVELSRRGVAAPPF